MREIARRLKEDRQQIIALWQATAATEPWVLLPDVDRVDFLPGVLERIADVIAEEPAPPDTIQELVDAALIHGHHRAELGVADHVIFTEYDLLRRALWRYLKSGDVDDQDGTRTILRVDAAISVATRASLIGYHRPHLEQQGRWTAALEQLMAELPLTVGRRSKRAADSSPYA